jgi:hypothetical protein
MEEKHYVRYFVAEWKRQIDLSGLVYSKEQKASVKQTVRSQGSAEASRFRTNKFPYAPCHCLSVTSGGIEEGLDDLGSLVFDECDVCLG